MWLQTTSVVAIGKHVVPARDRRGRRAGSHTWAGKKHAKPGRHAANRPERTAGALLMRRAFLAMRQRAFCVIQPSRVRTLDGAVIAPDPPTWQVMTRAAQTAAFGIAVIVGLMFAGFGAILAGSGPPAHPVVTDKLTPGPAHGLTSRGPATTAPKLGSSAYPAPPLADMRAGNPAGSGPGPTPTVHGKSRQGNLDRETPQVVPDLKPPNTDPELEAALNELDQKADRDRAWASRDPTPPVHPGYPAARQPTTGEDGAR
jgi:hypothetical protein